MGLFDVGDVVRGRDKVTDEVYEGMVCAVDAPLLEVCVDDGTYVDLEGHVALMHPAKWRERDVVQGPSGDSTVLGRDTVDIWNHLWPPGTSAWYLVERPGVMLYCPVLGPMERRSRWESPPERRPRTDCIECNGRGTVKVLVGHTGMAAAWLGGSSSTAVVPCRCVGGAR